MEGLAGASGGVVWRGSEEADACRMAWRLRPACSGSAPGLIVTQSLVWYYA
jgi:hypothetical protein